MMIIYVILTSRYTDLPSPLMSVSTLERDRLLGRSRFNRDIAGIFKLELFLPDDYPMTPPKIRFLTKIYHPNIDKLGRICLDVLKSRPFPCTAECCQRLMGIGNWSPALQIRTILLSIQALLGAPNPDDPLANDVAQRWKEDEQAAIQTAREWTRQYAKA